MPVAAVAAAENAYLVAQYPMFFQHIPRLRNFAQVLCNTFLGYHTQIQHVKSGGRTKKKPLIYKGLFLFEIGCGGRI